MRCNKCGAANPDSERFCLVCGHKLQSDRQGENDHVGPDGAGDAAPGAAPRLLDFQGWSKPGRGLGPYVEACVYGVLLAAGVAWCLYVGMFWPLYPLVAVCALAAWLRRL